MANVPWDAARIGIPRRGLRLREVNALEGELHVAASVAVVALFPGPPSSGRCPCLNRESRAGSPESGVWSLESESRVRSPESGVRSPESAVRRSPES